MSKVRRLRALVEERLTAAAEEIFALFERTIAEYEEELRRFQEKEKPRKQPLMSACGESQSRGPGAGAAERGRAVRESKEAELCGVQDCDAEEEPRPTLCLGVQTHWFSPELSLNQEIPETPQIKEEPEEQRLKQEEEQLPEFSAVCVKSEEQSSLLQQRQTEHRESTQREHCGGAGADISLDPHLHSETEESQAPYSCSICNNTFLDKCVLKAHKRTHKVGKHYCCLVCGKKYTHFFSLIEHNRTHTGQRPFCCPICGKSFAKKHHVKEHIRTHTGEKPFRCSICGEAFTRSSSLKTHKVKHPELLNVSASLQSSTSAETQRYLHRFMCL